VLVVSSVNEDGEIEAYDFGRRSHTYALFHEFA
jgi:hypothetical protein